MMNAECCLRTVEEQDLPVLLAWRNTERIRNAMYSNHVITWQEHYEWFQRSQDEQYPNKHYVFLQGHTPLGVVNFTDITMLHKRLTWGFYIGEASAPRGAGVMMATLALNKAFEEFGMHKICGEVLLDNIKSINYHERLGFVREGVLKQHIFKDNRYVDVIVFGLFYDAWQRRRETFTKLAYREAR